MTLREVMKLFGKWYNYIMYMTELDLVVLEKNVKKINRYLKRSCTYLCAEKAILYQRARRNR